RDYALLMIEGARSLGLAARFISGYLYDSAQTTSAQPHAWMEVYLPGAGWVEFDPTNGIVGSDRLIRVAVARDPEQAMPINGTFTGPAGVAINSIVEVEVRNVDAAASPEPAAAPEPPAKVIRSAA